MKILLNSFLTSWAVYSCIYLPNLKPSDDILIWLLCATTFIVVITGWVDIIGSIKNKRTKTSIK